MEIGRPHHVRGIGIDGRDGGHPGPFARTVDAHLEAFFAPQLYSVAGDRPSSAAISSPVLPVAVSSSARPSLRTMSSAKCRFRPAMLFIVPSSPRLGHETLEPVGCIHREHATSIAC
jgi:hypothetical protein